MSHLLRPIGNLADDNLLRGLSYKPHFTVLVSFINFIMSHPSASPGKSNASSISIKMSSLESTQLIPPLAADSAKFELNLNSYFHNGRVPSEQEVIMRLDCVNWSTNCWSGALVIISSGDPFWELTDEMI